jgi:phosphonatase-like hydrolase
MNAFHRESIRLVMFDLAGTTVRDGAAGSSLVIDALRGTLAGAGVQVDADTITGHRGKDKRDTIRELLRERSSRVVPDAELNQLVGQFTERLQSAISEFTEIPGSTDTFGFLQARGIRVGVGSGFPQELVDRLVERFHWRERGLIDYAMSSETVGAGRPDPRLIEQAMAHFGVRDPRQVVKVGDTVVDVEEGKNARVWTAAVLSGTQTEAMLSAAQPDFMLSSVAELPTIFA